METWGPIAALLAGVGGLVTAIIAYRKVGPERTNLITQAAERAVTTTIVAGENQERTLNEWIKFLEQKITALEATVSEKDSLISEQQAIINQQQELLAKYEQTIAHYETEMATLRARVSLLEETLRRVGIDPTAIS